MECRAICTSIGAPVVIGLNKSCKASPKGSPRHVAVRTKHEVRAVHVESNNLADIGRRSRRQENVEGEFYVDRTCIDCDTCRWMAPTVFAREGEQSAVHHQPTSQEERLTALQALLACPTSSIHTVSPPKDILAVQKTFPLAIDPDLPGVYHCGYHSELSYAAASYFITRPEGNILVDSPRYTEALARRLDAYGGVRHMFMTHKDDVADHKKWQSRFNCERILHEDEVTSLTKDVEVKLKGTGPWSLGSDIDLIFTPGHTKGHVVLHLKHKLALFSGDHLAKGSDGAFLLDREHTWYSVSLQIENIQALDAFDFIWLLPGHGRRHKFESVEEKNDNISAFVSRERHLSGVQN